MLASCLWDTHNLPSGTIVIVIYMGELRQRKRDFFLKPEFTLCEGGWVSGWDIYK